jgi:hypothetical protein
MKAACAFLKAGRRFFNWMAQCNECSTGEVSGGDELPIHISSFP